MSSLIESIRNLLLVFDANITANNLKDAKNSQDQLKLEILDLPLYDRSNPKSVP